MAVLVAAGLLSFAAPGAAAADAPAPVAGAGVATLEAEGAGLRAARAALLTRIATLSDEADETQARFVAAQRGQVAASAAAAEARDALVDHAVDAFVHAGAMGEAARARGGIFADVMADVDRAVVDTLGGAERAATAEHASAGAALAAARRAADEVAAGRAALEATIATNDVRTAAALAEEARNALARRLAEEAQAAQEAASAAARAASATATRLAARPPASGGGSYTAGHLDRFARATAAEAALMAAHRFGPVPGLPAGATFTGTVVEGPASWYGPGFDGRPTASGALYDQQGWTVASRELPLGTVFLVTRGDRSVLVLVNDRGPFVAGRVLDLSHGVAEELGTISAGVAGVRARVVTLP